MKHRKSSRIGNIEVALHTEDMKNSVGLPVISIKTDNWIIFNALWMFINPKLGKCHHYLHIVKMKHSALLVAAIVLNSSCGKVASQNGRRQLISGDLFYR